MNELLSFHAIQRDRAAQCRNVPDWIRAESLSRTFIPAKKGEEKTAFSANYLGGVVRGGSLHHDGRLGGLGADLGGLDGFADENRGRSGKSSHFTEKG